MNDVTLIRAVAGIAFVIVLLILIQRRRPKIYLEVLKAARARSAVHDSYTTRKGGCPPATRLSSEYFVTGGGIGSAGKSGRTGK